MATIRARRQSDGRRTVTERGHARHPNADDRRVSGGCFNHKRLLRVYRAMKLNLPRRTKRRLPTRMRQPLAAPAGLNQIWAIDFMPDALHSGRAFRTLNLIDEGNRQVLGIEVAHSIPSLRVIRVMEQLIELHGKPRALRLDNGPELTAIAFTEWCTTRGIDARFIQGGKPDQNAFIERFNKTYRDEVLDAYVFNSIQQVREVTETWLHEYNEERPHDSLGRVPPLRKSTVVPEKDSTRLMASL
jgi:putative transposase